MGNESRRLQKRYTTSGSESRHSPQKMILLSMILSKKPLLKSKPVRESQKGNRLKLDSNISKI
jgi:hypothetical protein